MLVGEKRQRNEGDNEEDDEEGDKNAGGADDGHVVAWTCEFIPKRLYVGPFIDNKKDAIALAKFGCCHGAAPITHIINIVPYTTEVTKSKHNRAYWYDGAFYYNQAAGERFSFAPTLIRDYLLPSPTHFSSLGEKQQLDIYLSLGRRIAAAIRDNPTHVYYLHNRTGRDEEAIVAFVAWCYFDATSVPTDVHAWLKDKMYEQLLNNQDQRILLAKVMQMARIDQNKGSAQMKAWMSTLPRIKRQSK